MNNNFLEIGFGKTDWQCLKNQKHKRVVIKRKNLAMNSPHVDFYIIANIDGKEKHIKVIELETTDGVPYYSCHIGDTEITQIRNELYGKWEQLWGNLPKEIIELIGEKILEKTTPP